ncbi:MAG: drug/metabolite exporter YedA [Myxococcota bacterium]
MNRTTTPDELLATAPAARPRLSPRAQLWLALGAVYVIWSSTYLVMRWAIDGMPALLMSGVRFTAAGLVMLLVARVRGTPLPTAREWRGAAIVGGLFFLGGNGLVAIAEEHLGSGLAAVVCATMPLWLALFSALAGHRPRPREWAGMALGMAGVAVLALGSDLGATPLAAILLACSPIAWALGSFLVPRLRLPQGIAAPGAEMLAGGLLLIVVGLVRGERLDAVAHAPAEAVAALGYLFVFGSLVGFTAFTWLLRHARPAVASSYAFVNPAFAVVLGVAFGGEPLGATTLLAVPLITAAVVLVVLAPRRT